VARVLVAGARQGTTSAGSVLRTSLRRNEPGSGRALSSWPPRTCPYRPLITKKSSRAVRGTPREFRRARRDFFQKSRRARRNSRGVPRTALWAVRGTHFFAKNEVQLFFEKAAPHFRKKLLIFSR